MTRQLFVIQIEEPYKKSYLVMHETSALQSKKVENTLYTYGFHVEFFRRRSTVRNNIIKNRSSTSPSSNIDLHSGPIKGSSRTLIGVIDRSSGITRKIPGFKKLNQPVTFRFSEDYEVQLNLIKCTVISEAILTKLILYV